MYWSYPYHNPVPVPAQQPMDRQRITMQRAREIALAQVPGQVLHVDVELEHGVLVYEVYILTQQNRVFEVNVLARTGRILKVEEEDDMD
ncbi:MAG TPA: PepSY domain-containing protein [Bacillaceae bacterium]